MQTNRAVKKERGGRIKGRRKGRKRKERERGKGRKRKGKIG